MIMRNYAFILLALICIPIFGQVSEKNKISIGAFYSPNISYRTLGDSKITDIRNEIEQPKFGFSTGLTIRYRINKAIGLESGLQFQSRGFQTKTITAITMEPDPIFPDKFKFVDRYYYLGLPLKLTLHKDFNKVSLIPTIGLIGNILLYNDMLTIEEFEGKTEKRTNDSEGNYDKFVLTSLIGLGVDFSISQAFEIMITPTFQYDITPIIDASLKTYLWDFGINIGCLYKF